MSLINEITLSITIFSIWLPASEAVGPFLNFLGHLVQFKIFMDFDEYDAVTCLIYLL